MLRTAKKKILAFDLDLDLSENTYQKISSSDCYVFSKAAVGKK